MLILESLQHWAEISAWTDFVLIWPRQWRAMRTARVQTEDAALISEITALADLAQSPNRGRGVGYRGEFAGEKISRAGCGDNGTAGIAMMCARLSVAMPGRSAR